MKSVFITPDDLKGFIAKTILFGQKGKRIYLHCDPVKKRIWYTLSMGPKDVYAGPNLNEAINLFNATD